MLCPSLCFSKKSGSGAEVAIEVAPGKKRVGGESVFRPLSAIKGCRKCGGFDPHQTEKVIGEVVKYVAREEQEEITGLPSISHLESEK